MDCQIPSENARLVRDKPLRPQIKMKKQGGRIIGNRTRPFAYIFRANEREKNLINKAIEASGLTMTEFVIRAITGKPVVVIDHASEMLSELKRQGNNLNQAVKSGYYGIDTEIELKSCIVELKKLYREIANAVGGTNAAS